MNEHMDKGLIGRQAFIGWMDSNEQASMNWMDGQRVNGQASIHCMDGHMDKGLMGRQASTGWMNMCTKG